MENQIYITHLMRNSVRINVWLPLEYITQIGDCDTYYFGLGFEIPFSKESIERGISVSHLVPLDERVPLLDEKKRPWLAPEGEVYLANNDDPGGDHEKILIEVNGF